MEEMEEKLLSPALRHSSTLERTASQLVEYVDPDHAMTSVLITDYKKHMNDGVVGDFPFPSGNDFRC